MGTALISGLLSSHTLPPTSIFSSDPDSSKLQTFSSQHGTHASPSNASLASSASVLVLCVKPHLVGPVLTDLRPHLRPSHHFLISIAAGVTLSTLTSLLPPGLPCARVNPNTPALIRQGATAISLSPDCSPQQSAITQTLFKAVGPTTILCPEKDLDAVTGLSGSGPAYVFLFLEALSDGGVRAGLTRPVANELAAQTVMGAAAMAVEQLKAGTRGGGLHVAALKDQVASAGGTTIAGIHALEKGGFRGTVMDAVYAATQRAAEMGRMYAKAEGQEGKGEGKQGGEGGETSKR